MILPVKKGYFVKVPCSRTPELQGLSLDHREISPEFAICQSINIATKYLTCNHDEWRVGDLLVGGRKRSCQQRRASFKLGSSERVADHSSGEAEIAKGMGAG
jgi:hypothetical protein